MSAEDTRVTIDHHVAALLAGDLDEIMADYAKDAVFISNLGGVLKGVDAIRPLFAATGVLSGFEISAEHIDGEVAHVTWAAEGIPFGTDTFLVRDGKIVVQTAALHLG